MPESFYLDNDISLQVRDELHHAGYDVVHVRDRGTRGHSDAQHLLTAGQDGRILVTHNGKDYLLLHDAWHRWAAAWGVSSQQSGILILPQRLDMHTIFVALDVFVRSEYPIRNEAYHYDAAASWVRHPYQP